jgi:hypothetical protein
MNKIIYFFYSFYFVGTNIVSLYFKKEDFCMLFFLFQFHKEKKLDLKGANKIGTYFIIYDKFFFDVVRK